MLFMNEMEIDEAVDRFYGLDSWPNLGEATRVLYNLKVWTNQNSDGWPYWSKPVRAARKLMEAIQSVDRWEPEDISDAELKAALSPIKAFLTRQSVDHSEVM